MKLLTRREVIPFLQERFRDKCLIWHSNPGVFKTCYPIFPCDCGFIASKEEEQEDNGQILTPSWDTLALWCWAHHLSILLLVSFVERKGAGIKIRPGLPRWCSGKESAYQCCKHKRYRFSPSAGKIPWSVILIMHSSIFAWKIPYAEEPGRLQSMGLQRVDHNIHT